jgi:hypothetical protein
MNGLSDTLTIGLVLALVFGALFFYLYSRIGQVEKRISLTENILLDLKMATENTMMAMASAADIMPHNVHEHEHEHVHEQVDRVEPVGLPQPVEKDEVEQIPDEEFYKQVLEQAQETVAATTSTDATSSNHVEPNYESMTTRELKAEAKRKNIAVAASASKKEVIAALKRQGTQMSVLEPVPGSDGALEEGFPVEA